VCSSDLVTPFAKGGVVSSPTLFSSNGGAGLMGEAGAEAILPLARGSDGRLGVRTTQGAASINVTFNISTPDVQGFRKSLYFERSNDNLGSIYARQNGLSGAFS